MSTDEPTQDASGLLVHQTEEQMRGDDVVSLEALQHYGFSDEVRHELIRLSENATYRVEDPGTGRTGILRVHRKNYHSLRAIQSELDWIQALRRSSDVNTNIVVPTVTGDRVYVTEVDGTERYAVMFEVMPGVEPDGEVIHATNFTTLGAITARLHQHAQSWEPRPGFQRFAWDWEHTLGDDPRWGSWRDGIGMTVEDEAVLEETCALMRSRLEEYGADPERYGLVHADLRLANVLVDDDSVNVIDFDDCGYSWFMYDFGTAVSFIEHDPRLAEWQRAWVEGYRSVRPLGQADEDMLATFVMLRRLLLVAWMGSHSHAPEVQELGKTFTGGTVDLARRYLASGGATIT